VPTPECNGKTDPAVALCPPHTSPPLSAQTSLSLRISPSRRLCLFILSTHCLAAAVIWLSRLDPWLCLFGDLLILLGYYRARRQHCTVGERVLCYGRQVVDESVQEQQDREQLGWSLCGPEQGAQGQSVELCSPVLIWSWLIVLQLRNGLGQRFSLALLADNTRADEVRRLRVLLRTGFTF